MKKFLFAGLSAAFLAVCVSGASAQTQLNHHSVDGVGEVADRALALTSLFEGTNMMALVRLPLNELKKYDEGLVKAALAIVYSD